MYRKQKKRNTEIPKYIDESDELLGGRRASLAKTRSTASFLPSTQISSELALVLQKFIALLLTNTSGIPQLIH